MVTYAEYTPSDKIEITKDKTLEAIYLGEENPCLFSVAHLRKIIISYRAQAYASLKKGHTKKAMELIGIASMARQFLRLQLEEIERHNMEVLEETTQRQERVTRSTTQREIRTIWGD